MTNNPLPVTLIGAGVAWFLASKNSGNGNGSYGSRTPLGTTQGIGAAGPSAVNKIGETATKIRDVATTTADGVSGSVQAMGDAVGDAASTAYHQAADGLSTMKASAMQAEERAMTAAKTALAFCQEQPLFLTGVGLALGAAIGAVLPHTEFEDKILGETSDEVKEAAKELTVGQLDKAKSLGGKLDEALNSNKAGQEDREHQRTRDYEPVGADQPSTGLH